MRTEQDFMEWLSGASIYINYDRYGQLGGYGFVCVSEYDVSGTLSEVVANLTSGDNEAFDAARIIEKRNCWRANDPNPGEAMRLLVEQMRRYFFEVLNKYGGEKTCKEI